MTASTTDLRVTRKFTQNVSSKTRNGDIMSRDISCITLSKRQKDSESPKKKLRIVSMDSSINAFEIESKFGLKLPKIKEKKINQYFNDKDFYY
jgi:hypothetical protein